MHIRCNGAVRLIGKEDGNVTVFSLFMLMLILTITGAAVDIMRHEAVRAKMQSTMDRAVLAAADLDQKQDPVDVVNDYMAKAGLSEVLSSVTVDQGMNYRTVAASGSTDLDTIFLSMSGFDQLPTPSASTAEEKISNVEISLVLDVSGSMYGDRIANLHTAAAEFIDTVIQPAGSPGLTTVSLVPYNATVNLGSELAPYFNLEENHDYSACPTFDRNDFYNTALDPDDQLDRLAHFDLWTTDKDTTSVPRPWCQTGTTSAIMAHSSDAQALKAHVQSLTAGGNTAIDLGVKWGAAMLDPSMNEAIVDMANDDIVSAAAADRPAGYNDPEAIKFIVVMTDGENTTQFDLKHRYKYGMSNIWIDDRGNNNPSDDRFSARVRDWSGTSNDVYFWPRYEDDDWNDRNRNYPDGGSNARQMSNAELYARFGTKAMAAKFLAQPYYDGFVSWDSYWDHYYGYESTVRFDEADDRLSDICQAARNQGVVIFSIAFEAPEAGQTALLDCASSASHYFAVEGVQITETFHAIARQINSLRLVQ